MTGSVAAHVTQPTFLRNIPLLYAIRVLFWAHFFGAVLVPFFTEWGGLKLSQVFYLNALVQAVQFRAGSVLGVSAGFFGRKVSLARGGLLVALPWLSRADDPASTT